MTGGRASAVRIVVRRVVRLPAAAVVLVLRGWQLVVSPTYGQTCRFYPSCSSYALEAVDRHGVVRGGWLALRRLGRCHPWNPGGVDPVPPGKGTARAAADGAALERPLQTTAASVADHRPPPRRAA